MLRTSQAANATKTMRATALVKDDSNDFVVYEWCKAPTSRLDFHQYLDDHIVCGSPYPWRLRVLQR
jgi:hypothetical protein